MYKGRSRKLSVTTLANCSCSIIPWQVVGAANAAYARATKNSSDKLDKATSTPLEAVGFLLGPWLSMARRLAADTAGAFDCQNSYGIHTCPDFLEWNARVQLTTWKPTPKNATKYVSGPEDYASKHWSGLLGGYYAPRVEKITQQAVADAAKPGGKLNTTAVDLVKAQHAHKWQLATNKFPSEVAGDALAVSKAMLNRYRVWYGTC